jgi:RNA polymerase primary sigma factor
MERLLGSLSSRERMVLLLRFGLEDGKDLTLEEVGKMMQITRERVRQIQDKAIKKLKHPAKLRLLRGDPRQTLDKTPFAPEADELGT